MKTIPTRIPDVILIEPQVFGDSRGFFLETYQDDRYAAMGVPGPFRQDNLSRSTRGVLRGLHFQWPFPQGKLVSVVEGEVFDVAVDLRPNSPTYRCWVGITLSDKNHHQLYIPRGFAHGFCVTSETALFSYKCTDVYHPEAERTLLWNDPDLGIAWPIENEPRLSGKDVLGKRLHELEPLLREMERGL